MRTVMTAVLTVALMLATIAGVRAQDAPAVRVGVLPIDAASELYYATDMGFFAKAGLNATLQPFPNPNVAIEALVSNLVDVAFVPTTALIGAFSKGLPLVAIAPAGSYDINKGRVAFIMIRDGVAVNGPKDVEGKIIATPALKGVIELATSLWIDKNGGDSSKVKYVELGFAASVPALQQGRVDGVVMVEPFATAARSVAHLVGPDPFSSVGDHWLGGAFISTKAWAATHPDDVRKFALAMRETADWANKNQAKSAVILSKYTSVDVPTINASTRVLFEGVLQPAALKPLIDLLVRYKVIDAPFKAEDLIYQAPK
jgi:NitT/TauT family transport system substrate-binding protein